MKKLTTMLVAACAALALLTGCGTGPAAPGTTQAQSTHNDADVTFARGMVPHHRQAVDMAELAAGRTENTAILDLATRIGAAQGPEIDVMTGWLTAWGAEVPGAMSGMEGMEGMDDGGGMDGMMTPEQMGQLEQSSDAAFDRLFLEQMTAHHTGAVEMARTELDAGADPDALALAQTIVDTQQAEIDEMATLLTQV